MVRISFSYSEGEKGIENSLLLEKRTMAILCLRGWREAPLIDTPENVGFRSIEKWEVNSLGDVCFNVIVESRKFRDRPSRSTVKEMLGWCLLRA